MLPSGTNFTIEGPTSQGHAKATLTEVGAGLRSLVIDGTRVMQDYPRDAITPLGAGLVMVPWPNRIRDGRWTLDGEVQQLAISEPVKNNALHGLLFQQPYRVYDRSLSKLTFHAVIYPQPGYPFVLGTSVQYSIEGDGIVVRHAITNLGTSPAPVAVGTHAYFRVGEVPTEDLVLTSPARSVFDNDERSLPLPKRAVSGADDLRDGRRVGDLALDHCFTDLDPVDGRTRVRLTAPDDRHVEVWMDEHFGHLVLLTTREFLADDGRSTLAVAIEPQTCSIDGFNTGDGLVWLQPSETWRVEWGVSASLK